MTRSALATLCLAATAAAQSPSYHVVSRIPVGAVGAGYFADFIAIDPDHRRLYGLGNTVIDIDKDQIIDSIPGKAAGGYALAPDIDRGLARNGTWFEISTGKVLGTVAGHGDAMLYDPSTHRAFMLLDTVTVVDMKTGQVVGREHFANALESGVADGKGMLYINREDSSIVTKVDARSLAVIGRYPIPDCKAAQGLSYDYTHDRLFLGCDKELVIVNAEAGTVVKRIPVAGHADQDAFDAGLQTAFNANRNDSTLVIVHEDSPDAYSVVGTIKTGGGARSVAVDPKTHKVYGFYYDQTATDRKQWVLTAVVLAPGAQ
jgi:hypothetical protein